MAIVLEVGQQVIIYSARIFSVAFKGYPLVCTVTYIPNQNRGHYCFDVPYDGGVISLSSYLSNLIFDVIQQDDPEGI